MTVEPDGPGNPDRVETLLPSLEDMRRLRVQMWHLDIDDVALDFTESLAEKMGLTAGWDKSRHLLTREYNGTAYRWSWKDHVSVDESSVETSVELVFRPDSLLRGDEVILTGFSQAGILNPETSRQGFTEGGPGLTGLGARLDVSPRKRAKILERIRDYLPHAWESGLEIAQQLPEEERKHKDKF